MNVNKRRVESLGVCGERKDFLKVFLSTNTGRAYEQRTGISFKNRIDTATCKYSMPFHSSEYVCLFENLLEEMKFFREKICQIFHVVGGGV